MKKNKKKIIWILILILIIILIGNIYLKIIIDEKNKIQNIFSKINIEDLKNVIDLLLKNNHEILNNQFNNIITELNNLNNIIKIEFTKIIYLRMILIIFIILFILTIIYYFNQYHKTKKYHENIKKKREEKNKLKKEIELAIKNRELKLFIQPRYNTNNKYISGGEILIRWIKDNREIIYPDEFIKKLEEYNLIKKLDIYILKNTCKKLEEWKEKKYPEIKISINQSPKNLFSQTYIEEIKKEINQYNFNHNLLEIELTENIFIKNRNKVKKLEEELHKLNIQIAIDDFGTGYSSYSLLNEIKIDILKLDKQLFHDLKNEKTKIIIEAIINMTKKLKINSIAEGIEEKDQVDFLEQIKCDEIQGYYFSKPKPIEEFENELKNIKTRYTRENKI